jgi:hypothetical protein
MPPAEQSLNFLNPSGRPLKIVAPLASGSFSAKQSVWTARHYVLVPFITILKAGECVGAAY